MKLGVMSSARYQRPILPRQSRPPRPGGWVLSIEHEDNNMSAQEGFSKAVSYLRGVLIREPPGKAWWF